jgi:hypothetical protein
MPVFPVRIVHRSTRPRRWPAACAVAAAILALATQCEFSQSPGQNTGQPLTNPQLGATPAGLLAARSRTPDANERMDMNEARIKQANFDAANLERLRQITQDSTLLLKLATELKAEIDKSSKDTLSLSVIRKAEEIEHLAHNVQVKMKLTAPAN